MTPRAGTCRGCQAPVLFAVSEDGPMVVLERHEAAGGSNRYAVWDDGMARPVHARRAVLAYPEHQCPANETRHEVRR